MSQSRSLAVQHARYAAHRSAPRTEGCARKLLVGPIRRERAARNRRGAARRKLGAPARARRHRHPVERLLALRPRARHQRHGRRDPGGLRLERRRRARSTPISRWRAAPRAQRRPCLRAWPSGRRRARAGNDQVVRHQLPLHGAGILRGQAFELASPKPVDEFLEAKALGYQTRPVLLGPVTYLKLGKSKDEGFDPLSLLRRTAAGLYRGAAPACRQRRRLGAAGRAGPGARSRRARRREAVREAYGRSRRALPR